MHQTSCNRGKLRQRGRSDLEGDREEGCRMGQPSSGPTSCLKGFMHSRGWGLAKGMLSSSCPLYTLRSSKGDLHVTWVRVGCGGWNAGSWAPCQTSWIGISEAGPGFDILIKSPRWFDSVLVTWCCYFWFTGVPNSNSKIWEPLGCTGGSGSPNSRAPFT